MCLRGAGDHGADFSADDCGQHEDSRVFPREAGEKKIVRIDVVIAKR